ncbi:MAG: DapH/DapD/GlmU-related protein [Syntrophorhabdaceae bacterium]|nr:DapH/DapD/GlmU-related protein [Syntrophorhabdaceae bacterium]
MYKIKYLDIFASEIAEFLGLKLIGKDFVVKYPSSVNNFGNKAFLYLSENDTIPEKKIKRHKDVLILTAKKLSSKHDGLSYIIVDNPRVKFINVLNEFFVEYDSVVISPSAKIDANARIGYGVSIGENTVIGPEVIIGNNSRIMNNVVITGRVRIGNNCFIKHNSTIGSTGYDFELDEDGKLIHFPHVGKISIGDNVWIGANTCIESSAIDDTVIEDNVKIDDLVQIGSNCVVKKGTMITAGAIISRQVVIGRHCLIAPNASIRDSVLIGNKVTIGIGAVVIRDLKDKGVYAGNPARLLRKRKEEQQSHDKK